MEGIDSFLIVTTSLIVVVIGLLILKQAVPLHWRRLTLPTMTWYAYVALLLIPSAGIVLWESPPSGYLTLGLILSSALCIPIGVFIAGAVWRSRPEEIHDFYMSPLETIPPWQRKNLLIFTGFVILFSVFFFAETGVPPLLEAMIHAGEANLLVQLRQHVTTDLRSPFSSIYFILRQFGWAFVLSCWLGVAWREGWGVSRWIGLVLLFLFGLFFCSATLTRSPAVVLFIVIFLFYYLYRRGQIPIFIPFLAAILSLSIPIVVLFLHDPSRTWESVCIGISRRIFYAPAKLNFQYIEIFPEQIGFLYGRGIGKISTFGRLFNPEYEYFPISQEVYQRIFPTSPYRGNAPAPFIGMAYANWGIWGPPVYGLLIGFVSQSIQIWLIRRCKNVLLLAGHAVLFYSFFEINRTDFFTVLVSYGGLIVPLLLGLLRLKWHKYLCLSKGIVPWEERFSGEPQRLVS